SLGNARPGRLLPGVGLSRVILDLAAPRRLRPHLPGMQSEDDSRSSVRLLRIRSRPLDRSQRSGGPGWLSPPRFEHGSLDPPSESGDIPEREPPASARPWVGALMLVAALGPALAALVAVPWFVTQDGPAHLYNAEILARSVATQSPFLASYRVRWEPL